MKAIAAALVLALAACTSPATRPAEHKALTMRPHDPLLREASAPRHPLIRAAARSRVRPPLRHKHRSATPRGPRTLDARTRALLWRIADCESGRNPRAVSRTGKYLGAWQWDLGTWHGQGEKGDPRDYPLNYQFIVAWRLYRGRGIAPWPVCGRKALR